MQPIHRNADEAEWQEWRRGGIGASEVSALLGLHPYMTKLSLYQSKVDPPETETAENPLFYWGHKLEPLIADEYERQTGRPLTSEGRFHSVIHPSCEFLFSTVDRRIHDEERGPGALECKSVDGSKLAEWRDSVPVHVRVQNQAQMACRGWSWGSTAALVGKRFFHSDHEADAELHGILADVVEEFWTKHVIPQKPPEPDTTKTIDQAIVAAMFPEATGEVVTFTSAQLRTVQEFQAARERRLAYEKIEASLGAEIRYILQGATWGQHPELDQYVKLATEKRKGYTKVVEPSESRVLRIVKSMK